jgi:penicillin amidase
MLTARGVGELLEAQREWVDPVNNLVCADTAGHIGYVTRGALPIRTSEAHRRFPVAGWTSECEWTGRVPFEEMPRVEDPPEGFVATANQAIVAGDRPYVAHSFAEPYRAERIVELIVDGGPADRARGGGPVVRAGGGGPVDCGHGGGPVDGGHRGIVDRARSAAMQADVTSTAARRWADFLRGQVPLDGMAEAARRMLAGWDGRLAADSGPALLYACFRRQVARALFEPVVGAPAWAWLVDGAQPAHELIVGRWLASIVSGLATGSRPPDGSSWRAVLQQGLDAAWRDAVALGGPDPEGWRWSAVRRLRDVQWLSGTPGGGPAALIGGPHRIGGDGDTLAVASYAFDIRAAFDTILVPVYRQVIDLADVASAAFVIPGGASGDPGSPHALDQLAEWTSGRLVPMRGDAP